MKKTMLTLVLVLALVLSVCAPMAGAADELDKNAALTLWLPDNAASAVMPEGTTVNDNPFINAIREHTGYPNLTVELITDGASQMNLLMASGEYPSAIYVNGDRAFDESDSVAHLNRYCLISPVSFSCGNLVPCMFKSSCDVTLLGRRSGGGACAVQPLVTADGTIWQVSSRLRLNTVANGSFYDVDEGAEPDVVIDKVADYYDREKLTDYINDLL